MLAFTGKEFSISGGDSADASRDWMGYIQADIQAEKDPTNMSVMRTKCE